MTRAITEARGGGSSNGFIRKGRGCPGRNGITRTHHGHVSIGSTRKVCCARIYKAETGDCIVSKARAPASKQLDVQKQKNTPPNLWSKTKTHSSSVRNRTWKMTPTNVCNKNLLNETSYKVMMVVSDHFPIRYPSVFVTMVDRFLEQFHSFNPSSFPRRSRGLNTFQFRNILECGGRFCRRCQAHPANQPQGR